MNNDDRLAKILDLGDRITALQRRIEVGRKELYVLRESRPKLEQETGYSTYVEWQTDLSQLALDTKQVEERIELCHDCIGRCEKLRSCLGEGIREEWRKRKRPAAPVKGVE